MLACWSPKVWIMSNKLFQSGAWKSAVSVTAGTIFQDMRKPLRFRFQMIWYWGWTKE